MSEIRRVGGAAGPVAAGRAARGGSGFRVAEGGGRAEAGQAAGGPAALGVSLLGLQEAGAAAERDQRARKRGLALIEQLRTLQAGLLRGRLEPALLRRLAVLTEGEAAADPALAEIIAAIQQRAQVELARLEMQRGAPGP